MLKFSKRCLAGALTVILGIGTSSALTMSLHYQKPNPQIFQTSPTVIYQGHLYSCAAPPVSGVAITTPFPIATTDVEGVAGVPPLLWYAGANIQPCVHNTNGQGAGVRGAAVGLFDSGSQQVILTTSDTGSPFSLVASYPSISNKPFTYDGKSYSFGGSCSDDPPAILCCFETVAGDCAAKK